MNETNPAPGAPDQGFHLNQVDPSRPYAYYRFLRGDQVLAELIAIAIAEGGDRYNFEANREYWRFNEALTSIDTYDFPDLNVTKETRDWNNEPPFHASHADFICSLAPRWEDLKADSPVSCNSYEEPFGQCGFRLEVERTDTSSAWVGKISWVRPEERISPLFLSRNDYLLTQATIDQGRTVVNLVGTQWTDPVTNYGDGEWRDPVVVAKFAAGLQVNYGGDKVGIANLRMAYLDKTFSAWASNDTDGVDEPPDGSVTLPSPVTQVSVRTGYYANYSLGLVDLDYGGGWVTGFEPDGTTQLDVVIPERCAVVGIQGKHRAGYGLVDLKIAYRELP